MCLLVLFIIRIVSHFQEMIRNWQRYLSIPDEAGAGASGEALCTLLQYGYSNIIIVLVCLLVYYHYYYYYYNYRCLFVLFCLGGTLRSVFRLSS